jgi:hypothetical protein
VLLWIAVVNYASVVDYTANSFSWILIDLPGSYWWRSLICSLGSLIAVSFLSAISCKVTRFSAEKTCEDFPLSVLLNGSLGVPPFSAASYALFVSISSWKEIFCFCDSCPSSSGRCVHGVVGLLWCVIMPWFVGRWWVWLCLEPVCSVLHMGVELLLLYCRVPPIFIILGFWSPHDVGIHCVRQGTGEEAQYQLLVDIISCVTYQLFKFGNECVEISSFQFKSSH